MAYFKEIVTKAVVGKGKKASEKEYIITPENKPDTVLGCWITNHKFNGNSVNDDIFVNGNFDINVWYSYDNNTKTGVASNTYSYNDKMNVNINDSSLSNKKEIIVSSLSDPNVIDVNVDGEDIKFTMHKELGVEVVGDTKIKVSAEDDYDDYEEIIDEEVTNDVFEDIDNEVTEEYLDEEKDASEESQ